MVKAMGEKARPLEEQNGLSFVVEALVKLEPCVVEPV